MTIKRYIRMEAQAFGQTTVQIVDSETGNVFLASEDNRHYQDYLNWIAEGNEPETQSCAAVCEVPK
jgi:hypothetical protein